MVGGDWDEAGHTASRSRSTNSSSSSRRVDERRPSAGWPYSRPNSSGRPCRCVVVLPLPCRAVFALLGSRVRSWLHPPITDVERTRQPQPPGRNCRGWRVLVSVCVRTCVWTWSTQSREHDAGPHLLAALVELALVLLRLGNALRVCLIRLHVQGLAAVDAREVPAVVAARAVGFHLRLRDGLLAVVAGEGDHNRKKAITRSNPAEWLFLTHFFNTHLLCRLCSVVRTMFAGGGAPAQPGASAYGAAGGKERGDTSFDIKTLIGFNYAVTCCIMIFRDDVSTTTFWREAEGGREVV